MTKNKHEAIAGKPLISPPEISFAQVGGLALLTSLLSFFFYYQHNSLLLYGDAVAHINIARRVFDSQTPGLLQLGTVWLPLPHLLLIPLLIPDQLWQSGAGGSFPSMVAYVFAVIGIFRFMRVLLATNSGAESQVIASSIGAWTGAIVFAANPNLIYLQTTAMTESLYLCFFIWAIVFFAEFIAEFKSSVAVSQLASAAFTTKINKPLLRSAVLLTAAELTRYDGWILAGLMGLVVLGLGLRPPRTVSRLVTIDFRKRAAIFLLLIACAPVLWLAYNRIIYGNALEFATGSYSARAIEARVNAPNPALHNSTVAASYFLKSAQLNMAEGNWGRFWVAAAVCVLFLAAWSMRPQIFPIICLWLPLPFYAFSIAYGSVPIHVSTWWPFATFNQRYGLQLLPLFAVSAGLLASYAVRMNADGRHRWKIAAVCLALVGLSYGSVWKAGPQCLSEAQRNWTQRYPLNAAVQRLVTSFPKKTVYLMDLSEHVGVMEQARIPLRQVINSENRRLWMRPTDPEGLWERALADPSKYVDFVIAFDGDMVDKLANKANLFEYAELHASGQASAKIYATRRGQAHAR